MEYSSEEWRYESGLEKYATDKYGGEDDDISIERYTRDIDLTARTGATLDFQFEGSDATDDLVLIIYKRGNDNWNGLEMPWKSSIIVENDGTERSYQYTIPRAYGAGHYRFGLKRSGSTTIFDLQVIAYRFRLWVRVREEE